MINLIKTLGFFTKGHERTLLAKKNIFFSLLLKGGGVLLSFIIIPLTINYVNPTQYGIWLTLSSIIAWVSFFDIGLGNGLKNKLAESNALGDIEKSKMYESTTYAIILLISLGIFLIFLCINPFLNWNTILNVAGSQSGNLNNLSLIVLGIFCIQFVIQLINVVLMASHATAKIGLITFISQLISLVFIYILTKTTSGSLLLLVLALAVIPLIVSLISSIYLFRTKYKSIAPGFYSVNLKQAKGLLKLGGIFFIIQIGQLVLHQTNNIIIAQLFGPREVTVFNLASKLFSVVLILFSIILSPFWSAFTDAYAKGDISWIKATYNKLQKFLFLVTIFVIALFILSPFIFKAWLGNLIQIPSLLSLITGICIILSCWHLLCCFLLNGLSKITLQLYLYLVCFVVNIPLAVFLGKTIGISGVVLANAIVYLFMCIFLSIQCHKILNNKATGIWNK